MVDRFNEVVPGYRVAKNSVVYKRQRDGDTVQREVVEVPCKSRAISSRRDEVLTFVII